MRWDYVCRYCHCELGTLDGSALSDEQLGLDQLTASERADIITGDAAGNSQVRVVCEVCQEALAQNPERVLTPYLFH